MRNFRITAVFISCAKDSIIIYSGWNCNAGYPTSVAQYPCTPKSFKLSLTPLMPALIVNVTAPPSTVQLCDTANYTAEAMNVQLGTAYHVYLKAILPLGVSLIPGSSRMKYPVSSPYVSISDPVFLGGTTWQWNISSSDSTIIDNGLKGILEPTLNSFKLTFKVVTTCGYTSGSIIAFNLLGEAACGLPTGQEVALSSQLGITGATTPYLTAIKLLTTYLSPCANNSSLAVTVSNLGPAAFSTTDSIVVQLPAGVSFISGSFSGIHNPPAIGVPAQYTLNGNVYLKWKLPVGIAAGDSSKFTFDYNGNPQELSCEITEFEAQTTSSTNVACSQSGINCGINIATGDTTLSVFTYKAYLSLSNGSATSIPNPSSGETVTVKLDITNTGQAILTGANSIIQFYYDTNGNGIYNTGDVYLKQDTLFVTNNATVPYSKTFNVAAGQACSIIAVIRTAVNPCVCYPSQLIISPRLISLGNDSTLCSGQLMTLSTPPVTGYTYSWSPITNLNNGAISNPVLTSSNVTALPVSTNYILTTNRMGCISKDTLKITVNPIPLSNAGQDTTSCPISTFGLLGTASVPGYSYSWFPATGLSSAIASNPTVSLANPDTTTYTVTTTSLGCSSKDSAIVRVNPLPTATISGTRGVCKDGTEPNITFTGVDGTAPFTFTYNLNGGANQTITTTSGNTTTIVAPTNVAGTFAYTLISVQEASSTACSQLQNGTATITVNPLPTATITGSTEVCEGAVSPNVIFKGNGGIAPYTFTYTINGGANQTVNSIGDSAIVPAPTSIVGTFVYTMIKVQYGSLTSCSQIETGTATIKVNPSPTATISGTVQVCKDGALPNITFTGAIGTPPYTFTYTINGGTNQTLSTTAGSSVTLAAPTSVAGTFIYALVSIKDSSLSGCMQAQTGTATVTVKVLPTATITGTTTICKGDTPSDITFTGADGIAPYTFTYAINGATQPTITTGSGNSISVLAPTSVSGTFVYSIVSVRESSSTLCAQQQAGSATVTVNPIPTATITGTTKVCKDGLSPDITFTGNAGTPPYTFTYSINSGANQTVSTISGNSVIVQAPTGTAGTFTYSLVSIQDASPSICSQTQSGSATITVNPLPTATITGTTSVCKDGSAPVITFTGANGTAPYTFTFSINTVTQPTVTSTGNSVQVSVPTLVADTFTYSLVSVIEASSIACSQTQTGDAIVTVNPLPTATIAGAIAVCKNSNPPNITFTGANGIAPYTFTYKVNGGANQTISTTNGNSVTLAAPTGTVGTFTYTLVSVAEAGSTTCFQTQTGTAAVVINPLPVANFGFTNVCLNRILNFNDLSTVSSGSIVGWSWDFSNNDPLDITQNPGYMYADPGTYNVTLVSTTNNGCKDTTAKNVVVHPLPAPQFYAANVCDGITTTFNDLSTILTTDTLQAWTWDFGDSSPQSNNQVASHLYADPGSYLVHLLVVSNFGCSDSIIKTTIVNPNPDVHFAANDTVGCELFCIYFQDASSVLTGTNVQWMWNVGDGSPSGYSSNFEHCYSNDSVFVVDASTGTDFWKWDFGDLQMESLFNPAPHTYADTGTYTITLITSTQYGCADTSYQNVIIEPDFAFYIPNAFSPNDDDINDTFIGKGIFIKDFDMKIFDRWGNLVFVSTDINKPWDGKANYGTELAQMDVYIYLIKLTDIKMNPHKYTGKVTLVR
ncbi:MAG: gliding motility-associated C-terminal domain-containing protein [Bacteroidetes bacterium]|nr:gliding motility-associated C-terminal domain-containing protein [Bacteroidota bacterium]